MKRLTVLIAIAFFLLGTMPLTASAFSLPANEDLEMDVIGFTGLYRDFQDSDGDDVDDNFGVEDTDGDGKIAIPSGTAPQLGDQSRAFLRINDIGTLYPDWGGSQDENVWTDGDNGETLFAVENELEVTQIIQDTDGETHIFFNGIDDGNGNFETYLNSPIDWNPDISEGDPQDWSGLYNQVSSGTKLWDGEFTQSTYQADFDGDKVLETVNAQVGITLNELLDGGGWIENTETPLSPEGLTMNPQAWLNLDPAYSYPWQEDFWGAGKDLAIGNVGLESAASFQWTSKADDWTRGHTVPEPSTMLLLGSGLLGIGIWGRKKYTTKS